MIRTILPVPFLILISYFCGRSLLLIFGVFPKDKKEFFSSVASGTLVLLTVSFASHFLTVMRSSLLSDEKKLFGILAVIALTVLYFTFVVMTFVKMVRTKEEKTDKKSKTPLSKAALLTASLAILLSVICLVLVLGGRYICSEGDETLETVVSFLDNEVMYSIDPLKGAPYAEGLPLRHKILCLPSLYAVLSEAFKISPELLVYHIMPAFWFFAGLCAICSLSSALFPDSDDKIFKRSVFATFALIFIFGCNVSPYAQGFGIMSSMWTGYAIRTWLLIPFMLSMLLRKKYILALFPAICEAFICRTQYGIGFSAIIYVLFILAGLVAERRRNA